MGQHNGKLKVRANVCVQGKGCLVDGITLSYARRRSCCGRKRRRLVAAFAFPRNGWKQESSGETRRNTSSEAAVVPLGHLRKKDGNTAVLVSCMANRVPVYTTEVTVADLLRRLDLTTRGKEAAVFFSLSGGKTEGNTQAQTFTALFFNGRRCGDGGAATPADTAHRPHAQPVGEAEGSTGNANPSHNTLEGHMGEMEDKESPSLQNKEKELTAQMAAEAPKATSPDPHDGSGEESSEEEASPEPDPEFDIFEASTSSDWACEEDGKDEEVQHDDGMEQQEDGEFCGVKGSSPTLCSQGWRDALGYITSAVAVMLVFYNAWLEYTRD